MFPDFNRLKLFSMVYAHSSVSDAAKTLKISQPAVSQQLKKLERELKIPLFTRTNKRLIPTPAAKRLYQKIAPFLDDLQAEITHLRRPLDTPYGQLKMGASPLFGRQILPKICSHFRFRFPTVTFTLDLADNDTLISGLGNGRFDLVLLECPDHKAAPVGDDKRRLFEFESLFIEKQVLVCSADYYRRKLHRKADYTTLKNQEYLQTQHTALLLEQWFRLNFKRVPLNLNTVLWSNDLQVIVNGVRSGMGLAILPHHLVYDRLETGGCMAVPPHRRQLIRKLVLATMKNKKTGLTEKAFTSILKKELSKMQTAHAPRTSGPDVAKPTAQ